MNPLAQFKKISIPPLRIAPAFVALTALMIMPALLGKAPSIETQGLRM